MALATSFRVRDSDDKPTFETGAPARGGPPVSVRGPARRPAGAATGAVATRVLAALVAFMPAGVGATDAAATEAVQPLQSIVAAAEATVRQALPRPSAAGSAAAVPRIVARPPDPRLRLARCAGDLTGSLPAGAAGLRGRGVVQVNCAGPVRWNVLVPVSVETEVEVLVTRKTLSRGAIPGADDLESRLMTLPGMADTYISNLEQLEGLQLARPLAAGAALTRDALMAGPVVRRGEAVTLVTAIGGLQVRAPGLALQDARPGDRVRVQNVNSLKVVEGRADKQGMIEVDR